MTITGTAQLGPNTGMHQATGPGDMNAAEAVARDALSSTPGWGRLKRHELWKVLDLNGIPYDARTATSNDMVKIIEAEQLRGRRITLPPEWGASAETGGTPQPAAAPQPDPRVDELTDKFDALSGKLDSVMQVVGSLVEAMPKAPTPAPEPPPKVTGEALRVLDRPELRAQAKLRGMAKFQTVDTKEDMQRKIRAHDLDNPEPEGGQDTP